MLLKKVLRYARDKVVRYASSKDYWTKVNVTEHHKFSNPEESLDYLDWRNRCYLYYDDHMPTSGADGKVVLDFGCGPGHDLVGFGVNSNCKKLIGMDVSSTSVEEARSRLELHGIEPDVRLCESESGQTGLDAESVDLVHCSGVLHHTPNPERIIREFHRILKPGGSAQIMVYNYHSLWVHLYVAYECMVKESQYSGLSVADAFQKTTDGVNCPISRYYTADEFNELAEKCGFESTFLGASISNFMEMRRIPMRHEALVSRELGQEHRDFLYNLTFDKRGAPLYNGHVAGIGACFSLKKSA